MRSDFSLNNYDIFAFIHERDCPPPRKVVFFGLATNTLNVRNKNNNNNGQQRRARPRATFVHAEKVSGVGSVPPREHSLDHSAKTYISLLHFTGGL